jgi:hypothetical protein
MPPRITRAQFKDLNLSIGRTRRLVAQTGKLGRGTFWKYTGFLQKRDERTFIWSTQRYTLTRSGHPVLF